MNDSDSFLTGYTYRAVMAIDGTYLAQYRIDGSDWCTIRTRAHGNTSSLQPAPFTKRSAAEAAAQDAAKKLLAKRAP
jgi:hypothetical protein